MRGGVRSTLSAALAAFALAGCGSDEPPETPAACLAPAAGYLRALEGAPAEVRLDGTTPIGDCLVEEQAPGAQQQVGQAMISTATVLNREVRRRPERERILALGYLVGTVQEAASATGGIHRDLVLRLDSAARYSPRSRGFPASFERAFGEGYAAGQASG